MAIKVTGNKNMNAMIMYQENDYPVFYVRPFSEETKNDLDRLIEDVRRVSPHTIITEKNGTYRVSSRISMDDLDFMSSMWGILLRRFLAESKTVCMDPVTEEKYYKLIISHEFIEPCARRLAS